MIVGWQRVKNELRNAGLRVLQFALVSAPAVVSAAVDPWATFFIKTSGTQFSMMRWPLARMWSAPSPRQHSDRSTEASVRFGTGRHCKEAG